MGTTDNHAVTGRTVRRPAGRPGRTDGPHRRAHAPTDRTSPHRGDGTDIELTLLDVFEASVARVRRSHRG
jgi:hypothetical protein